MTLPDLPSPMQPALVRPHAPASRRLPALLRAVPALLLALCALPATAQVTLTALDTPVTQTFNTLPASGSNTWTSNSTIPGWYAVREGTGTTILADTGSGNAGALYSYGAAGNSDRALGSVGSSNAAAGDFYYGVRLRNNTGATITSLDVAYAGEQWRSSAAVAQTVTFSFLVGAPTVAGTLAEFQLAGTPVAALDFTSPITGGTAGAQNGNGSAARREYSATLSGLNIPAGGEIMLRWADPDHAGTDHGLAIDDVSITPHGSSPLPSLSIEDVENNEGSSGLTPFTFTVQLSAPAPAGGVTFDIATADGTATAPSDYIARTLTGQFIAAGDSSYTFSVDVVGDTVPESDETFSVTISNVTGANVTNASATGTIFNDDGGAQLSIDGVSANEGNSGATTFSFLVNLSEPAPVGGVTFDIATADGTATAPSDYIARALTGQTIDAGNNSYSFDVQVNGDTTFEPDETFSVHVTNIVGALAGNTSATGTIRNDDAEPLDRIHAVQGSGATSPMVGATVTVEAVVIGSYQASTKLSGFFLQEEDADADANLNTSEGIFVFCGGCPVSVSEGQRVRVTGMVSEHFNSTQITASTPASVSVTSAANHLDDVTPASITLPISGDVNAYHEARESMLVRYTDTLQVGEYFQLGRFGQVTLYQGDRPRHFTTQNAPNAAGYAAHLAALERRRVILDDEDNGDNGVLNKPNGQQDVFLPQANGGFGTGTQGVDFFRGGDTVENLVGVLHWSFAGLTGTDAWRIRPTAAQPATFSVANPRPTAPQIDGAIKAASVNVLNYFSSIDTTASNSSGNCGPSGTLDCRGADSAAELARQRERTSIVLCGLNADVVGLVEIENHPTGAALTDLVNAVNARCHNGKPYAIAGSGNSVGNDAIRVALMYRTGVLSPVGALQIDTNTIHNRPPNGQTFDVVDAGNPAFGERFSAVVNHFKSKSCASAGGADADSGDGQACYSSRRTQQAARLLTWINGTLVPAAGDPDVLILGDLNAYSNEPPITTLVSGGYADLVRDLLDADTGYSYLFDGQLGHLDYVLASASLLGQVADVAPWHINADEVPLFDYNDEIRDTGEAAFEKKPDGRQLTPPRHLFEPASPYRASDHDPVLVGLFPTLAGADLGISVTDSPDPVAPGAQLTYQISVGNAGPDAADDAQWSTTLPANTRFASLDSAAGWTCSTPAVDGVGTVTCLQPTLPIGTAAFTLRVTVAASAQAGSVLNFSASVGSESADSNSGNNGAAVTTTVSGQPAGQLQISPTSVDFGNVAVGDASNVAFVTLSNTGAGPLSVSALTDASAPFIRSGGTCPANVPFTLQSGTHCLLGYAFIPTTTGIAGQTLSLGAGSGGNGTITLAGMGVNNTDPQADVAVSIDDGRTLVGVGETLAYAIVVRNNTGPSTAVVTVQNALPAALGDGVWDCMATGAATCSNGSGNVLDDVATLPAGTSVTYVYSATVQPGSEATTFDNTVTATLAAGVTDPDPSNNTATDTNQVRNPVFDDGFESPVVE